MLVDVRRVGIVSMIEMAQVVDTGADHESKLKLDIHDESYKAKP